MEVISQKGGQKKSRRDIPRDAITINHAGDRLKVASEAIPAAWGRCWDHDRGSPISSERECGGRKVPSALMGAAV